eukprot:4767556-Pyramimonas_sp.AAC.1
MALTEEELDEAPVEGAKAEVAPPADPAPPPKRKLKPEVEVGPVAPPTPSIECPNSPGEPEHVGEDAVMGSPEEEPALGDAPMAGGEFGQP